MKGPWEPAGTLPESFKKLPADDNWKDVKANLPGKKGKPTTVFVSTVPAELILLQGAPNYLLVRARAICCGSATPRATSSAWARPGRSTSSWPAGGSRRRGSRGRGRSRRRTCRRRSSRFPLEHARSRVLASVPGTDQAVEAVLLASIPQTARVSRKDVKAPDVAYQGDPKFEPIPSTTVARAVNTDKDIIKVGDLYYMCFEGVWFVAKAPTGPWTVADSIPKAIYEIPVSSPSYNVTYVTVEESNDDWVVFATAVAFTGVMIAWGCAVWGTGYYHPPYWGWYGGLPVLLSALPHLRIRRHLQPVDRRLRPRRRGVRPLRRRRRGRPLQPEDRHLRPRRGGVRAVRRARRRAGLQPADGHLRPDAPGFERLRQLGHDRRAARRRLGADLARDQQRHGQHDARHRRAAAAASPSRRNQAGAGGRTTVARSGSGDVYAGHDGNVYKKEGDSWQKYDNGGWSDVQQPTQAQKDQAKSTAQQRGGQTAGTTATQTAARSGQAAGSNPTVSQLNSDRAARSEGAARTGAYSGYQRGTSSASSYRGRRRHAQPAQRRGRPAQVAVQIPHRRGR